MVSETKLLGNYNNCIAQVGMFLNKSSRAMNYVGVKGTYVDVNGNPTNKKERFVIELTEPLYFRD